MLVNLISSSEKCKFYVFSVIIGSGFEPPKHPPITYASEFARFFQSTVTVTVIIFNNNPCTRSRF